METNKDETEKKSAFAPPGNIPEWVTHLLTGLGTMGAQYMMFVKPIQEKAEQQAEQIREMQKRINRLEAQISSRWSKNSQRHWDTETDYPRQEERTRQSPKQHYDTDEDRELISMRRSRPSAFKNRDTPFKTYKP